MLDVFLILCPHLVYVLFFLWLTGSTEICSFFSLHLNFFIIYIRFVLCVNALPAYIYVCTMFMLGAWGGQRKALDPLKLELEMVVGLHVDAGT